MTTCQYITFSSKVPKHQMNSVDTIRGEKLMKTTYFCNVLLLSALIFLDHCDNVDLAFITIFKGFAQTDEANH